MIRTDGPTDRTSGAVAVGSAALASAVLLTAACGPVDEAGREGPDTLTAHDTQATRDSPADTLGPAADTVAGNLEVRVDSPAADSVAAADTTEAAPRAAADTSPEQAEEDTAGRRMSPGGYVVYVRRGESPDSVAAAYGVEPDTVLSGLPGFYARLTAEQATCLSRDARVRELARQLEERPLPEPRGMPTGGDTTSSEG